MAGGVIALAAAALLRRGRYWMCGIALASLAWGAAVAMPALSIDAYPTTYGRPSVSYNAISLAQGLALYRENCAVCHGVAGYGDGPAAERLVPRPSDLTAGHTGAHTAGDLFWWLTHGVPGTAMPGFGLALDPEERWDLINFVRALSAAEQARGLFAAVEPNPWLVAPDFSYATDHGEAKSLKDHRGKSVVLLVFFTPASRSRLVQLDQAYGTLTSLGVEVLAVPGAEGPASWAEHFVRSLPIVTEGGPEVFEAYALFRRSFSEQGSLPDPPLPSYMEFLIDRQGYIRARWIAGERVGWANTENLVREVEKLNTEKPLVTAADEHVH
jgi:putative copper resistance protein D